MPVVEPLEVAQQLEPVAQVLVLLQVAAPEGTPPLEVKQA
jgi:hypothetical protein